MHRISVRNYEMSDGQSKLTVLRIYTRCPTKKVFLALTVAGVLILPELTETFFDRTALYSCPISV